MSLVLVTGLGYAEDMNFVTVLSSPVGTFANLETADASLRTAADVVRLGSNRLSTGTITLNGTVGASLGKVVLGSNASLITDANVVQLSKIDLRGAGTLTGKSLLASTMNVDDAMQAQLSVNGTSTAGQLAVDTVGELTASSVGATRLTINRANGKKDTFVGSNSSGKDMMWSNEYMTDYRSSGEAGNETYERQYLLKGKRLGQVRYDPLRSGVDIRTFVGQEPVTLGEGVCVMTAVPDIGDFSSCGTGQLSPGGGKS